MGMPKLQDNEMQKSNKENNTRMNELTKLNLERNIHTPVWILDAENCVFKKVVGTKQESTHLTVIFLKQNVLGLILLLLQP